MPVLSKALSAVDPGTAPDIDHILEAIRAEARARGSKGRIGSYSTQLAGSSAAPVATYGLPQLDRRHAADYLALPMDVFIDAAYQEILGREPDGGGLAHYQRALLRGHITRIEMLGRLAFSGEGRRKGGRIEGLAPAFAMALVYRIPLVGTMASLLARTLRLPAHWQDRSAIEAAAVADGSWMKR